MDKPFKLVVFSNALFFALYLLWNWNEYSILNGMYQVSIRAYFPLTILFSGTKVGYDILLVSDVNFGLVFFFLAMFVNLCAYRLQRSKATKKD